MMLLLLPSSGSEGGRGGGGGSVDEILHRPQEVHWRDPRHGWTLLGGSAGGGEKGEIISSPPLPGGGGFTVSSAGAPEPSGYMQHEASRGTFEHTNNRKRVGVLILLLQKTEFT